MKNGTLLLIFIMAFCISFCQSGPNTPTTDTSQTETPDSSAFIEKAILITHIKDGNGLGMPNLTESTIKLTRGSLSSEVTKITFPHELKVQNGDIIEFIHADKEKLTILVDDILKLSQIGVNLYTAIDDSLENISGTVRRNDGTVVQGLHLHVGASPLNTNLNGKFNTNKSPGNSFNLRFFGISSGSDLGSITVLLATSNGGKTVIDVAFDDTGVISDLD